MRHSRIGKLSLRRWGPVAACALAALGGAVGCDYDGQSSRRAPESAVPDRIEVPGGRVVLGHALGRIQEEAEVGGFRIAKYPVTVGAYELCVNLGGCSAPGSASEPSVWEGTYNPGPDYTDVPMVGLSAEEAEGYCEWVGGRLPSYPEWQVAARGPSIQPYPWGDAPPTCEKSHLVPDMDGQVVRCCDGSCTRPKVGQHAAGASPSGVEDILLVPGGEFIGSAHDGTGAKVMRCRRRACVVKSEMAGRGTIDSLVGADGERKSGFRCVWKDKS